MDDAHYLIFRRGERWYAALVDRSVEVLEISAPTRVPGASPPIQGVIAHRGEVIPLVDLAQAPDGSQARQPQPALQAVEEETHRAVLLRSTSGPLALSLSEVRGLVELPSPDRLWGESGLGACLRGPVLYREVEVAVIDPERLYTFLCRAEVPGV